MPIPIVWKMPNIGPPILGSSHYIQMYAPQQLSPTPLIYAATAVLLFSGICARP